MEMSLPVKLTDEEKLKIAEEDLSPALTALEDAKKEKREAMRSHNAAIKAHEKRIHELNEALATGQVLRDVEVSEEKDYAAGMVYIRRTDTNEVVKQRAIDPDERQVGLGLPTPGTLPGPGEAVDGGKTDEQRVASTPEEAEAMRDERLKQERAERISAAVIEARPRISVLPSNDRPPPWFRGVLQHGNRVIEAEADTEDAAREGVVTQLVEHLEADEDAAALTWADVAAASEETQRQAEVEQLAAEQAEDDAQTNGKGKKRAPGPKADGLKSGGLKAPPGARGKKSTAKTPDIEEPKANGRKVKRISAELPDGRVVDPEQEADAADAVVADEVDTTPPEGCAF